MRTTYVTKLPSSQTVKQVHVLQSSSNFKLNNKQTKSNTKMKRTQTQVSYKKCLIPSLITFLTITLLFLLLNPIPSTHPPPTSSFLIPPLPRFAYFISGSHSDTSRLIRLLKSTYHPLNTYLAHLDLEASDEERLGLARIVKDEPVFRKFGNVMVVGKADLVTSRGPTMVACLLHAVAVLLKKAEWDWFVNLSVKDYPLVPQDDLLHIFSYLPRYLNFIEHTSDIGWKEFQRARPIIIDPALYHSKKTGVYWAKEKRSMPVSFKLFTGSEWVVLSRSFLEFSVWGWDNLPRTLLMYYTNFLSSHEGYFHTVICNHKDYQNTTANHDLRYTKLGEPPNEIPLNLTLDHLREVLDSGAPFAREFAEGDPVLDKIDKEILRRKDGGFTPGGWCVGKSRVNKDPCLVYGSPYVVKPSVNSKRLEKLILQLLDSDHFRTKQCR